MGQKIARRYYGYCPLVEDFHIKNVLGGRERRQLIFGYTHTLVAGADAITLSTMTGGLITQADYYQVLVTADQVYASARPRIASKTATQISLTGEAAGVYDLIVFVTLPTKPQATPKWAKDYCPGCKDLDFWGLVGSITKDTALIHSRVQLGGAGTLAFVFSTHTAIYGDTATDLYTTGEKGSLHSPLVANMANDDYQVIVSGDSESTAMPYVSSKTAQGFTITGDASDYFNVFVLGQISSN
jgi:hypothetical protein